MKLERELERLIAIDLARGRSKEYVQRYRFEVRRLQGFLSKRGKDDLREATEDDIVDYLLWLETKKRLRKTTVTNAFFILRRLFGFLHKGAVLLENPVSNLSRKRYPRRMRDWLTEEEAAAILEQPDTTTIAGLRDRAMLEVFYSSGLRLGELVRLEVEDVDLGEGLVTVKPSKNGAFRRVPLGKTAQHWIARYLAEARSRLVARRELGQSSAQLLFLNEDGARVHSALPGAALARYTKAAGIKKKVTPHVLRHSFAIHLLANGASTRHIQAMLGHRHLASTQVYTRLLPADLKRVHARCHPAERAARRKRGPAK